MNLNIYPKGINNYFFVDNKYTNKDYNKNNFLLNVTYLNKNLMGIGPTPNPRGIRPNPEFKIKIN